MIALHKNRNLYTDACKTFFLVERGGGVQKQQHFPRDQKIDETYILTK